MDNENTAYIILCFTHLANQPLIILNFFVVILYENFTWPSSNASPSINREASIITRNTITCSSFHFYRQQCYAGNIFIMSMNNFWLKWNNNILFCSVTLLQKRALLTVVDFVLSFLLSNCQEHVIYELHCQKKLDYFN